MGGEGRAMMAQTTHLLTTAQAGVCGRWTDWAAWQSTMWFLSEIFEVKVLFFGNLRSIWYFVTWGPGMNWSRRTGALYTQLHPMFTVMFLVEMFVHSSWLLSFNNGSNVVNMWSDMLLGVLISWQLVELQLFPDTLVVLCLLTLKITLLWPAYALEDVVQQNICLRNWQRNCLRWKISFFFLL